VTVGSEISLMLDEREHLYNRAAAVDRMQQWRKQAATILVADFARPARAPIRDRAHVTLSSAHFPIIAAESPNTPVPAEHLTTRW
jgi:hypothetical protein